MRFVISGEWTRNRLLKVIVACFLVYTFFLWLTNAGLFFYRMSLRPSAVIEYYRGSEEKFLQPRSLVGLLEQLHFHTFAMGILLLTLTHLLLFVPLSLRTKAYGIAGSFSAALLGELSGWGVRFVHPGFAYLKIFSFLVLQGMILWLMIMVAWALWTEAPSAYGRPPARPQYPVD
ncbi:MAG: hypothetical protein KatS3mg077_0981 [Candidatus Binatia bacterium]|nr:MAG: hypothetical protein KatS3mg077_0981 [Candidatus Binatia bacterium]